MREPGGWSGKPIALSLERVGKTYGVRRVLHDFSLNMMGGEVVAITGVNGAGKSTLLKIAAGVLRASRGVVSLTVGDETTLSGAERRTRVGYAGPDLAFYPELTGRENLQFFARVRVNEQNRGSRGVDACLDAVGLRERGGDAVGAYSSGMRQRLRLAFAQLAMPPILLLDEPSLALDASGVDLVERIIAAQRAAGGLTVVATNDAREAAIGDRIVALGR